MWLLDWRIQMSKIKPIHAKGRGWITVHERKWGWFFIFPAFVFMSLFMLYPTLNAFYLSFFKYEIVSKPIFNGIGNYQRFFKDQDFWYSFKITLIYVFSTAAIITILSLISALTMNLQLKGQSIYRTIFFLPSVMSLVAVAIIFKGIFHQRGLVNYYLSLFVTSDFKPIQWISQMPYALIAIIIVRVWRAFGFFMVIFLAGLQNIPLDYYDASKIDGCTALKQFKYITLPLLTPTTVLVSLLAVVNAFQAFTEPYIMTGGGPADRTRILPIMLYEIGFRYFKMGEAATLSIIIFVVIGIFSIIQFNFNRKYKVEY